MDDWATISALATAGVTLVAIATFVSVRSANRSARVAPVDTPWAIGTSASRLPTVSS